MYIVVVEFRNIYVKYSYFRPIHTPTYFCLSPTTDVIFIFIWKKYEYVLNILLFIFSECVYRTSDAKTIGWYMVRCQKWRIGNHCRRPSSSLWADDKIVHNLWHKQLLHANKRCRACYLRSVMETLMINATKCNLVNIYKKCHTEKKQDMVLTLIGVKFWPLLSDTYGHLCSSVWGHSDLVTFLKFDPLWSPDKKGAWTKRGPLNTVAVYTWFR